MYTSMCRIPPRSLLRYVHVNRVHVHVMCFTVVSTSHQSDADYKDFPELHGQQGSAVALAVTAVRPHRVFARFLREIAA